VSLHHPENRLENVCIFFLPLFNSVVKTLFLGLKKIGGAFAPALTFPCSPQVTPADEYVHDFGGEVCLKE
jgi:hypothetical protein